MEENLNEWKDELLLAERLIQSARSSFVAFLALISPPESHYVLGKIHLHLATICEEAMRPDGKPNHTISLPPQHGKSRLIIRFAAWALGAYPGISIALTGFSGELLGDFLKEIVALMDAPIYKRVFATLSVRKSDDRWNYKAFNNRSVIAVRSAGSKLTGRRADLLIVDDAHPGREEAESVTLRGKVIRWFTADCLSRISPHAKIFVIGTRWHPDDLIGYITNDKFKNDLIDAGFKDMIFHEHKFPAICDVDEDEIGRKRGEALFPECRPIEFILRQKAQLLDYEFRSQFQQVPTTSRGGQINPNNIIPIAKDELPPLERITRIASGWDLAATDNTASDYTCGICAMRDKDDNLYIVDCVKDKLPITKLIPFMEERAKYWVDAYNCRMLGVEGVAGFVGYYHLIRERLLGKVSVRLKNPPKGGGKLVRAQKWIVATEARKIYMVRGAWNKDFLAECVEFPDGKHDDQVDAMSIVYETLFNTSRILID